MPTTDLIDGNPAYRLLGLMTDLRAQPGANPLATSFALVVEEAHDTKGRVEAIHGFFQLIEETKDRLRATGDIDAELWIETWEPPVVAVLEGVLTGQPTSYLENKLTDSVVLQLRHVVAKIGGRQDFLGDTEYAELRDQVTELINSILNEGEALPPDLKEFLLEQALLMSRALTLAPVCGPEGLQRALRSVVGAVVLRSTEGATLPAKDSTVGAQFFGALTRWGLLVTAGQGVGELGMQIGTAAAAIAGVG